MENESWPLRLIDVETTLNSIDRGGISFTRNSKWHVISHTWSENVRCLSKIIGRKLEDAYKNNCAPTYEQLFESANFAKDDSYLELLKFLNTLKTAGVRWVWFDALCINQTDNREKDREIQQMGTYYEKSLGCYVVQHGIGMGFKLLDHHSGERGSSPSLPRWFSRVWTFQEWILPRKTTFILEDLDIRLASAANVILSTENGQGCWCCFYENSFSPQLIRSCTFSPSHAEGLLCETAKGCRANRPHFQKVIREAGRYFVDDLGYIFLLRVQYQLTKILGMDENQLLDRLELNMRFRGTSEYRISPEMKLHLAIEEISRRDSSNQEDRVLSILKVMGVEGAVQVRSGKTLQQQVIHLVKSLVEKQQEQGQGLILRLCMVDCWGSDRPHMSWAPDFEVSQGSRQEGTRKLIDKWISIDYYEMFKAEATVRKVTEEGQLRVEGEVVDGELVSYEHGMAEEYRRAEWKEETRTPMAIKVNGKVILNMLARWSEEIPDVCSVEPVPVYSAGQGNIVLSEPGIHRQLKHLRQSIQLRLLRMGSAQPIGRDSSVIFTYFLVVIGSRRQGSRCQNNCYPCFRQHGLFHKIGYLGVPSSGPLGSLSNSSRTMLTIGGFGNDLDMYVLPTHARSP